MATAFKTLVSLIVPILQFIFMCTAVHAILSFSVSFSRLFFLYLFLGISSCFGVANEEKEKARSENGTEKVKNVEHRN